MKPFYFGLNSLQHPFFVGCSLSMSTASTACFPIGCSSNWILTYSWCHPIALYCPTTTGKLCRLPPFLQKALTSWWSKIYRRTCRSMNQPWSKLIRLPQNLLSLHPLYWWLFFTGSIGVHFAYMEILPFLVKDCHPSSPNTSSQELYLFVCIMYVASVQ